MNYVSTIEHTLDSTGYAWNRNETLEIKGYTMTWVMDEISIAIIYTYKIPPKNLQDDLDNELSTYDLGMVTLKYSQSNIDKLKDQLYRAIELIEGEEDIILVLDQDITKNEN